MSSMSDTSPHDRMRKSVENLVRAGGRVITVRLTPAANSVLTRCMAGDPGSTTTKWINQALENMQLPRADQGEGNPGPAQGCTE